MNFSNSTTDKTERLKDTNSLANQWKTINWTKVEIEINRLQTRIAKATADGERNKAKRLQYLLTHSFSAKAFAVRKVTTNKGKNTSGIDKKLWSTSSAKMKAVLALTDKGYRSKPLKRVYIAKKGKNKKRPLGIPTVKDRIVQAAVKIVIEPIFEADFKDCSYGFRPKRNQHMALESIRKACNNNGIWVLDANIKGCFDNINHQKLMKLLERRISDKRILKLIRKWLKVGVINNGIFEESEIGSPQGGVISPLLANIYLNYLDTVWEKYFSKLGKLIRFADDFVVVCKNYKAVKHARRAIEEIMSRLELELNQEKTQIVSLWNGKEGFDFLGLHNRMIKHKNVRGYEYYQLVQWLSIKAKKSIKEKVRVFLGRNTFYYNLKHRIIDLNRKIDGWRNYYGISRYDKLRQLDKYICMRFVLWFNGKRQSRKRKDYYEVAKMIYGMGLKRLAV